MLDRSPSPLQPLRVTFDGDPIPRRPRELVKRLVPYSAGSIAFIGGQSGAGKTFIAVRLAICIASATPFFDLAVRDACGVIYLAAEGAETVYERLTAAKLSLGIDAPLPVAIVDLRANLADEGARKTVCGQLRELAARMVADQSCERVGALIIDTVASAFAMQDENSNAEVARVAGYLRDVGRATGCVTLPVHHYGKTDTAGLRGGSAWRAAADTVISITADRDELTGDVTARAVALAKSRVGEEGRISGFTLEFQELGTDCYGETYGSCSVVACELPQKKKPDKAKSWADMTFTDAFADALLTTGVRRHVAGNGPEVLAVKIKYVRAEFMRKYASGEEGTTKQSSQRSAWKRALERAQISRRFGSETDRDGDGWIWEL